MLMEKKIQEIFKDFKLKKWVFKMEVNYDYDIRETFNDTLGANMLETLCENISDYDELRLAVELLRFATERLNSDLNDKKINEEYIKLHFIIEQLEQIIKNYV